MIPSDPIAPEPKLQIVAGLTSLSHIAQEASIQNSKRPTRQQNTNR